MFLPESPWEMATWRAQHYSLFTAVIRLGFFILSKAPAYLFTRSPLIERRGKHLDELTSKDRAFIRFNQWVTVLLVLNMFHYCTVSPNIRWQLGQLSPLNTLAAIPAFYIVYDFVYTLMHRALHHRSIYGQIHKHHHHQVVPTRGTTDAINVHPVEFLMGEWNHLLAVHVTCSFIVSCHVLAVLLFLASGGLLASLNHTRHDVRIRLRLPCIGTLLVYDVRAHDVHHRLPRSNYGQYIMLWDRLMGSFKAYEATI